MNDVQTPSEPALDDVASAGKAATTVAASPRLDSIDLLRGLVMVIMALDHTRDFFTNVRFVPTDLSQTTVELFLTRWLTHYCAPVFVFLAGTGAFLTGARGKSRTQLARFLFTRGLWLIVLEFTLVHLGWSFTIASFQLLLGQVIWAIGCSMIVLSGLVFLPAEVLGVLGIVLIAGHNALDEWKPGGWIGETWKVFKSAGFLGKWPRGFVAAYPILPWLGIMLAGYGCGKLWLLPRPARRRSLLALGLAATTLFVVLRASNRYGDPQVWKLQATDIFTFLSFLNCTKYPPSLLYVLMTLGPALCLLAWWDREPGAVGRIFVTYGRVPLFYYLLHVPLIHVLAIALAYLRHGDVRFLFQHILFGHEGFPEDYGYGLPAVYAVWLLAVAALYCPCRWFAELKRRRRDAWLSYL